LLCLSLPFQFFHAATGKRTVKNTILFLFVLTAFLHAQAAAFVGISADSLHAWIASGDSLVLLDVREQYEYDPRHIPGAILMPWSSEVVQQRYSTLPAHVPIVVICKAGSRSAYAAAFLEEEDPESFVGYIYVLVGGMDGWPYEVIDSESEKRSIALDTDLLAFGEIYLDSSAAKSFTIYNTGSESVAVSEISCTNSELFALEPGSALITAGDSQLVLVTFHPGERGTFNDTIFITSDALGGTTLALAVSGSGITALAGDVDSSGRVDIFDLLALLKVLSQKASTIKADIDFNGKINIFDLLELLKILSGK
jgi:phage shock protein E